MQLTRRQLLAASAGLIATPALAKVDPFPLGVASGDPSVDGFVIWTRLCADPLHPTGGMQPTAVDVDWEIADDEQFRRIVRRGRAVAEAQWAHSVHVEVAGLEADRWYWYRFHAAAATSPVGRSRTLPAPGRELARLRFALASCQNYEEGYYAAYRHMAASAPDFVVHVGDYIYDSNRVWTVRSHHGGAAKRLADYRIRYAQYRTDPDLRAAHAACPWLATWDDHEVQNDYAGLVPATEARRDSFARRRAAAYQAYYEHMPLRQRSRPRDGSMPLYRSVTYGGLASLYLLDTRQYRDDQACSIAGNRGGRVLNEEQCPSRHEPGRSLLGAPQERWLDAGLAASGARWNVLAQQLLMAPLDQNPGKGVTWWSDAWEGYPAARARLLRSLRDQRVSNPVVLGGDIHSYWVTELALEGRPLATEFVGTSISSKGLAYGRFADLLPENPHVKFFESRLRGYTAFELTPQRLTVQLRVIDDVTDPRSAARTLKSFVVESGAPRVLPG
jgi:alkaline phosphatase D